MLRRLRGSVWSTIIDDDKKCNSFVKFVAGTTQHSKIKGIFATRLSTKNDRLQILILFIKKKFLEY